MSALQSLRALDRRVLPTPRKTPEAWRKTASRWWVMLIFAGFYVTTALAVATLMESGAARLLALSGLLPTSLIFAYVAGQQKAEDDRLNGRDPLANRRPPGV